MQASCTPNMKVSTWILRPINFVYLANQTSGVLHSPPTPTQGGSSSSKLVMTTSLNPKILLTSADAIEATNFSLTWKQKNNIFPPYWKKVYTSFFALPFTLIRSPLCFLFRLLVPHNWRAWNRLSWLKTTTQDKKCNLIIYFSTDICLFIAQLSARMPLITKISESECFIAGPISVRPVKFL